MAHWERGYRVHGYWSDIHDNKRLGAVGIGPRCNWDGTYRWYVDAKPDDVKEEPTLRRAKRSVEKVVLDSGEE